MVETGVEIRLNMVGREGRFCSPLVQHIRAYVLSCCPARLREGVVGRRPDYRRRVSGRFTQLKPALQRPHQPG